MAEILRESGGHRRARPWEAGQRDKILACLERYGAVMTRGGHDVWEAVMPEFTVTAVTKKRRKENGSEQERGFSEGLRDKD